MQIDRGLIGELLSEPNPSLALQRFVAEFTSFEQGWPGQDLFADAREDSSVLEHLIEWAVFGEQIAHKAGMPTRPFPSRSDRESFVSELSLLIAELKLSFNGQVQDGPGLH